MRVLFSYGSRVICQVNSESVKRSLGLPLPSIGQSVLQFTEISSLSTIKALDSEQISSFISKMLKPDLSPSNYIFPYDISLFIKPIQIAFSLLSQILGLDNDRLVTKVMIGTLCLVSQSK